MKQGLRERVAVAFSPAVLGILAFALVLIATDPPGPGLDPDALAYLGSAESVAASLDYRVPAAAWESADSTAPLAHFPPGYSTALALPVRLGMPAPQSARLVNALAAGVTTAAMVLLVGAATTPLAGILLALAFFAMPAMHSVHASVLSEPLFLACVALTLAAMTTAPERPWRAGLAAALGASTRYAGIALVGAAVLWPLLRPASITQRIRRALLALLPALVLQAAWVIRTRFVAGPSAIRHFAINGDMARPLRQGAKTLRDWLVPPPAWTSEPVSHRGGMALAAAALLVAMLVAVLVTPPPNEERRAAADRARTLLAACGLLMVCYVATIVASRLVADAGIPFDERILAPLLLLATTGAAVAIAAWWAGRRALPTRVLVAVALLAWWGAAASATGEQARYALDWGSDFAGSEWRTSALLGWARGEGARHPLYSNWPAAVWFHLHRPARALPLLGEARAVVAFTDTLRRRDGRVLAFAVAGPEYVTAATLVRSGELRIEATLDDGVVLAPAPEPVPTRTAAPREQNRSPSPGVYRVRPPVRGATAPPRNR